MKLKKFLLAAVFMALDRRALVSTSDDRTWSKIRSTLAANYPWLDQVFTLCRDAPEGLAALER